MSGFLVVACVGSMYSFQWLNNIPLYATPLGVCLKLLTFDLVVNVGETKELYITYT